MKILLIANEKAGTGRIRHRIIDIIVRFMEAGYEVKIYPIAPEKGFTSEKVLTGDLSEYDKVVVAGGDGTMSHVIQALMLLPEEERPVLGYIPAGSTNDFAKSLGIPDAVSGACRTIITGREFRYDIGRFQDTWFNYVAAFGAFVPVSFGTDQKAKNRLGHGAYILEAVGSFHENISFSCPMSVEWDNRQSADSLRTVATVDAAEQETGDGTVPRMEQSEMNVESDRMASMAGHAEGDFMFGAVYNASSIGGFRLPNASLQHLHDGEMELLLIRKPESIEDRREIVTSLMNSDIQNSRFIITAHVRHVRFHSDRQITWTLDGEDGGSHEDVRIGVAPQAMRIMIPKRN